MGEGPTQLVVGKTGTGAGRLWLPAEAKREGRDLESARAALPSSPEVDAARDNCWRRHFAAKLKAVGLEWVNFQVMRRTHSSLMRELQVDPKVVADQLGHSLDVNLNVYTETPLRLRKEAVNALETAPGVM